MESCPESVQGDGPGAEVVRMHPHDCTGGEAIESNHRRDGQVGRGGTFQAQAEGRRGSGERPESPKDLDERLDGEIAEARDELEREIQ